MKVTVCINDTKIVVPCGDGDLSVRQLAELAIIRYRKTVSLKKNLPECIEINSLKLASDGGILDWDDKVQHVLDDKDLLIASVSNKPQVESKGTNYFDDFQKISLFSPRHNSIPCSDQDALRQQIDIMKESTTSSGVRHESLDNFMDIVNDNIPLSHTNRLSLDYEKWPLPPFPTNNSTLQSSNDATLIPQDIRSSNNSPNEDQVWDDCDEEDYPRLRPDYIVKRLENMNRHKGELGGNLSNIPLTQQQQQQENLTMNPPIFRSLATNWTSATGIGIHTTTNLCGSSSTSGTSPNNKEVLRWLDSQHDCSAGTTSSSSVGGSGVPNQVPSNITNPPSHTLIQPIISTCANTTTNDLEDRNNNKIFASSSSVSSNHEIHASNKNAISIETYTHQLFGIANSIKIINKNLGENLGIKIRPWYFPTNISEPIHSTGDSEQKTLFGIEVHSVVPDGRVAKEGQFSKGDRIIQINESCLIGMTFEKADALFRDSLKYPECNLKVVPNSSSSQLLNSSTNSSSTTTTPAQLSSSPIATTSTTTQVCTNTTPQQQYPPPPPRRSPNTSLTQTVPQQTQPQPVTPLKYTTCHSTNTTTTTTNKVATTRQAVASGTSGFGSMYNTSTSSISSVSQSAQLPPPLPTNHPTQVQHSNAPPPLSTHSTTTATTASHQKQQHQHHFKHPNNSYDDESSSKKVLKTLIEEIELTKTEHGFGFSIMGTDNVDPNKISGVFVRHILKDGAARSDGKLKPNDKLLEIDGLILQDMSQTDVINLLREKPNGSRVKLVVERRITSSNMLPGRLGGALSHESLITSELDEDGSTISKGKHSGVLGGVYGGEKILKLNIPLTYPETSGGVLSSDRPTLGVSVKVEPEWQHRGSSSRASDSVIMSSSHYAPDEINEANIVWVKTVIENGAAHRDGRLKVGDQILRVNDQRLSGLSSEEALSRLKNIIKIAQESADSMIRMEIKRKLNFGRSSSLNSITNSGSMNSFVPSLYEQHHTYFYSDNGSVSDKQSAGLYRGVNKYRNDKRSSSGDVDINLMHNNNPVTNDSCKDNSSNVPNKICVQVQHHTIPSNPNTNTIKRAAPNIPTQPPPPVPTSIDTSLIPSTSSNTSVSVPQDNTSLLDNSLPLQHLYTNVPQQQQLQSTANNYTQTTKHTTTSSHVTTTSTCTTNTSSKGPPIIRRLKKHDTDIIAEVENEPSSYDYIDESKMNNESKNNDTKGLSNNNSNNAPTSPFYNYPGLYSPPKQFHYPVTFSSEFDSPSHASGTCSQTNTLCRHQANASREARARNARSNCSMVTPTISDEISSAKCTAKHIDEVDWSKMEFLPFDERKAAIILKKKAIRAASSSCTRDQPTSTSPPHHQSAIHIGSSERHERIVQSTQKHNKYTHGSQPIIHSSNSSTQSKKTSESNNSNKKKKFKKFTSIFKHSMAHKPSNSAGSSPVTSRKMNKVLRDTSEGSDIGYRPGNFPASNSSHSIQSTSTEEHHQRTSQPDEIPEYPYADLDFVYNPATNQTTSISPPKPPIRSTNPMPTSFQKYRPAPQPPSPAPPLFSTSNKPLPPPLIPSTTVTTSSMTPHHHHHQYYQFHHPHHHHPPPTSTQTDLLMSSLVTLPEESFINTTKYTSDNNTILSAAVAAISTAFPHRDNNHLYRTTDVNFEDVVGDDDSDSDSYEDFEDVQTIVPGYMSAAKRIAAAMPKQPSNRKIYEDAEELFQNLQANANYTSSDLLSLSSPLPKPPTQPLPLISTNRNHTTAITTTSTTTFLKSFKSNNFIPTTNTLLNNNNDINDNNNNNYKDNDKIISLYSNVQK